MIDWDSFRPSPAPSTELLINPTSFSIISGPLSVLLSHGFCSSWFHQWNKACSYTTNGFNCSCSIGWIPFEEGSHSNFLRVASVNAQPIKTIQWICLWLSTQHSDSCNLVKNSPFTFRRKPISIGPKVLHSSVVETMHGAQRVANTYLLYNWIEFKIGLHNHNLNYFLNVSCTIVQGFYMNVS